MPLSLFGNILNGLLCTPRPWDGSSSCTLQIKISHNVSFWVGRRALQVESLIEKNDAPLPSRHDFVVFLLLDRFYLSDGLGSRAAIRAQNQCFVVRHRSPELRNKPRRGNCARLR